MSQINFFLQKKFLADTYINRGIEITHGEGVYLFDNKGKRYLDMMSNYGVNLLGYGNKKISNAIINQAHKITTLHSSFNNDARSQAIEKLVNHVGHRLKKVYLSNSGTEAVEAAIKFAMLSTRRNRFLSFHNGYHGKTIGSLAVNGIQKYTRPFEGILPKFSKIEYGNIEMLQKQINENIAGVIIETVQGEGGVYSVNRQYLSEIRRLCEENGCLFIIDEIQTGLGRTGYFLSIDVYDDLNPDIITLGKGLAGGIPVGATCITMQVNNSLVKGIHTSTFGGNPLACAGISATLELLNDDLLKHVKTTSEYFHSQLKKLIDPRNIRIKGLMVGIDVGLERDQILKDLQKNKMLAIPAAKEILRLLPPLILQREHIDEFISVFRRTINKYNV